MRDVATPNFSPIAEQTPKAFHSIKFFISYSGFIMTNVKLLKMITG